MHLSLLLLALPPGELPVPPAMPRREIAPPETPPSGTVVELGDQPGSYVLYVPDTWRPSAEVRLTSHFHTAAWFGMAEHRRAGLAGPLLVVNLGQGSSVYRQPFEDPEHFAGLLTRVVAELRKLGAPANCRVAAVAISSFSAGYGAVRELVRDPRWVALIDRIVLCDSLYAGFEPGSREPARENMAPWIPFCQAAARGEKRFCLTFSEVPTETYASTGECAEALVEAVGGAWSEVPAGSLPATDDPEFRLLRRADVGGFHAWGYAGDDAPAHLTHVRHLADVWLALGAW